MISPNDWLRIRTAWETDERTSFGWLPEYVQIKVSRQAIEKRAKADGWKKREELRPAPQKKKVVATQKKDATAKVATKVAAKKPPKHQKVAEKTTKVAEKTVANDGCNTPQSATATNAVDQVIKNDSLTETEQLFVLEYLKDFDATNAARRMGYKGKSPRTYGYKMLQKPQVRAACRDVVATRAKSIGVDGDKLMQLWSDIVSFDANELCEFRRIPCPWCYSTNGEPQMTIARYLSEKAKHDKKRDSILIGSNGETDIGEFPLARMFDFVDTNKAPNPECPVCRGVGDEMRVLKDTRYLSARAKMMYCGTESTKDGYNFVTLDKEKAIDNLAKALFLFREKDEEEQIAFARPEELTKRFNNVMAHARDQQIKALKARGMDDADVVDVWPDGTPAEEKEGGSNGA